MNTRLLSLFFIILFLVPTITGAADTQKVLPANEVFIPQVTQVSPKTITVEIDIKPGYYLYRERLFDVTTKPDNNINIININRSLGKTKTDQFFGSQSIWYGEKNQAIIDIDYENPKQLHSITLALKYQGCQDGVICYPPQTVSLPVQLPTSTPSSHQLLDLSLSPKTTTSSSLDNLLGNKATSDVLSEEQAFPYFIEQIDATTVAIRWQVAKGHYLYRDKIKVTDDTDNIASIQLSPGQEHSDNFFGTQSVYYGNEGVANIYLRQPQQHTTLDLSFQGCAEKGICYPVIKRQVIIDNDGISSTQNTASSTQSTTVIQRLTNALENNIWLGVGLLLVAGIALSFTPCVLPMLPILLGIITNQHKVSKQRAAILSTAYALGVAVMMAVFGLIVAKTGINLQIIFQKPLWLIAFAMIFILMGLAMLGAFSIAMPNGIQNKVIKWQNRFQDAKPSNLFVVGALSTLVVGPCIAPPLIAILAFISTTNDSLLGAVYLFSLGLGMSLPLVIFATLVTSVPRTGEFSRLVTRVFAMLMFAVGLWLLSRLLPASVNLIVWGVFMLSLAYLFIRSRFTRNYAKVITLILSLLVGGIGSAWLIGGLTGHKNLLKPFSQTIELPFRRVNTADELNTILANSQRPVMLDLYADWCVSCQEVEHITFADAQVIAALESFELIKLDITDTDDNHRALLKQLNLIGPPALLFFDQGKEMTTERQIGTTSATLLLEKLHRIQSTQASK